MMRRRKFITLLRGVAAWSVAAGAQQREGMRPLGVSLPATASDPEYPRDRGVPAGTRLGVFGG